MLNQLERWVLHYDLKIMPLPDDSPSIPMLDIIPEVVRLQGRGEAVWVFQNETAAVRIAAIEIDHDSSIALILLHYADKNVSDPVFGNLETGDLRQETKLDGEGVAVSAHMLISLLPSAPQSDIYLTVLEDVPGIGRTKICPFLTSIFKKSCSDFRFKDEHGKEKRCRPGVQMLGHASQSLRDDLRDGVLSGFELVRHQYKNGEFDEEGYIEEKARIVTIKVARGFFGEKAVHLINHVMGRAKDLGYSDMRVKFKKKEGRQKTIVMGTAREDAGDALSARSAFLRVDTPLPQCSASFRADVVEKMKCMLVSVRNGIAYQEDEVGEIDYTADAGEMLEDLSAI